MANIIRQRRNNILDTVPGSLDEGQFGLNLQSGKVYYGTSGGATVEIITSGCNRAAVAPTAPLTNELWYDTAAKQLKLFNGATWDVVTGAPVVVFVNKAALANYPTTSIVHPMVAVTLGGATFGDGGEGIYGWDAASHTVDVAADPAEATWVAPAIPGDGSTGAWKIHPHPTPPTLSFDYLPITGGGALPLTDQKLLITDSLIYTLPSIATVTDGFTYVVRNKVTALPVINPAGLDPIINRGNVADTQISFVGDTKIEIVAMGANWEVYDLGV